MTTKDYATLECELKALDKDTLCNLISDLMFFDKIDITDINYIYINRLKEKMAEKDRVIFEADKCIFESVFTDSLGKPADNAAVLRKLEWMEKTGMHNMDGIMSYLKDAKK